MSEEMTNRRLIQFAAGLFRRAADDMQADQQLEKDDPEEEHEDQSPAGARREARSPAGKALETVGRMRRRIIGAAGGSVDLKIVTA